MNTRIGPVGGEAMSCTEARHLAADLALGALAGDDRARLLEHLEGCPGCETLVAELAGVVDSLLLLTPEADPPAGFESAVLSRIAVEAPAARRWRLRTAIVSAAAAAVLVAASVGVTVAVDGSGGAARRAPVASAVPGGAVRTAALVGDNGYAWGQAYLFTGHTSWVFVDLKWDVPNGSYTTMLDRTDGPSMAMNGLHVIDGEGSFGHTVGAATDVSAVRIVDQNGHTVCRAVLQSA